MIFGREHELAALNAAYAQMLQGHGSVFFLTGEAGLGKTTLVHAWAATRDMPPRSLFLESACSIPIGNVDVGRLEALQPWADVVAQLHEKLASESSTSSDASASADANDNGKPHRKLDVRKLMRDAAPAWLWALPFVGEVAHAALVTARLVQDQRTGKESQVHSPTGPDPSSSPVNNGSTTPVIDDRRFAAANQEQVFQQYVNLLSKIAETTPLIIFLDDLHWADTSSCNLLFYLARQIEGKRILVIATYRQDDAVRGSDGKGHAILTVKNEILRYSTGIELALSYLSRDAIRAFLSNTFTSYSSDGTSTEYIADERFEQWLHKISDGNSLFMTQFVKTLCEDGHLDDNGKFTGDYTTVVIPTSALSVVEERARRLDDGTRKLLMYATAEGEEFTTYVLERLTKRDPLELFEELQSATALGMIVQRGTGRLFANTTTGIFGFSHALFHRALYNALLDVQKQYLHGQCFQLLKAEWDRLSDTKDRTTTLATKLLAHAAKCEEWSTVAEVALAAGQEFWKAFNEAESLAMIARVLDAGVATDETNAKVSDNSFTAFHAEALYLRGEIGELRGRYVEACADFRAAEMSFARAGNTERAIVALNRAAGALHQSGSDDACLVEANRALENARGIDYHRGQASALTTIGLVYNRRGDFDEARSYYEQSLAICTEIGERQGEATALNNIGGLYLQSGGSDQSLSYYQRSLAMLTAIGDRRGEALSLNNIANVFTSKGDFHEALAYSERSLTLLTSIGDKSGEAHCLSTIGLVHNELGSHDKALSYFYRSLAVYTDIGNPQGEAHNLYCIGAALCDRGTYDEALSYTLRSLEMFIASGNRFGETAALQSVGSTLRLSGKTSEARSYLEKALATATTIYYQSAVAYIKAELGLISEAESQTLAGAESAVKRVEAQRLLEEAFDLLREMNRERETVKWESALQRIKASQ